MAKNDTTNNALTTNQQPDLDFLKSLGMGALDDLTQRDIIMPRYKLVQSTSRKGTPGKWISNVSDEEHDTLNVVILGISNYRIYFPAPGEGDKPLCRSNDGVTKADPSGCGDGRCDRCRYNVWTKDPQGNSVPPKCRGGYTLLVLVAKPDGTFEPGMISIKGAAMKPAKSFFTKMKTRGVPPLSYITKVSSVSEVNAKGRFFRAQLDFPEDGGWLPKEVVMDIAEQAKNYIQYVGTAAMVDDEIEHDVAPMSTGSQDFLNSLGQNVGGPALDDDLPF